VIHIEGNIFWVGEALSKVSVLSIDDQSLELFGQGLPDELRVLIEPIDVSFIPSVEEDGAHLGVPVLSIHQVPYVKGVRLALTSEVVEVGGEPALGGLMRVIAWRAGVNGEVCLRQEARQGQHQGYHLY